MEYKGIYYKETNEPEFYEGGAHFSYKDLYKCLEQLCKKQKLFASHSPNNVKFFIFKNIYNQCLKIRNKKSNLIQNKTGNNSIYTFNSKGSNLFINTLKTNKKIFNGKKEEIENEKKKKSNGFHTKESSVNSIKKTYSTRNKKIINNPPNTILNYNYSKKKRTISLNNDYINKTILSKNKKERKSLEFSINEIKSINDIRKKNLSNEKKNKSLISQNQKQKKEKDKNIKKSIDLSNTITKYNKEKYKLFSEMKKKERKKIINRSTSNISSILNKKISEECLKISSNKNKKKDNESIINGLNKNNLINDKKSRNKKNNSVTYYKSNSIDNRKINGLISSSTTTDMKTMNNGNSKIKKKMVPIRNIFSSRMIQSFLKNNIYNKSNISGNYAQIYLKKNNLENGMSKNQIINNKSNIKKNNKK